MFAKKIIYSLVIFFMLLSTSVASAEDSLREADNWVGNIIQSIVEYFSSEDNNPASTDVVETGGNREETSDEDTYVDIESGVTPPVPPEDATDDIEKIYPSVVCAGKNGNMVCLCLEFLNYYESASPVYGETFTYDPEGDLNFKFFHGSERTGNFPVSCLEFHYGLCTLSVPGIDEFDRIEIWQGSTMISSKKISPTKKVPVEEELEISSLYHDFDDKGETIAVTVQKSGGGCSYLYSVYAVISQEMTDTDSGRKINYPDFETDPFELRFGDDGFATSQAFRIQPGGHNKVTVTLYDEVSGKKIDSETLKV